MSYHKTARKIEDAFKSYLLSEDCDVSQQLILAGGASAGQNVYTGVASGQKEPPCIVVAALSGNQDLEFSGNFWFEVGIAVRCHGINGGDEVTEEEEARTAFSAVASAAHDAVMSDGLIDFLNAQGVENFTAIGAKDFSVQENTSEDCQESEMRFMLYCAPADLS